MELEELSAKQDKILQALSYLMKKDGNAAGQGSGFSQDSKKITRDYFDSLLVEMRLMDSEMPVTETEIFGRKYISPIMTAAISHLKTFHKDWNDPMEAYAQAAKDAGILHWVGMTKLDEFERIMKVGADTVRIVKPYADEELVKAQFIQAKELGCVAVGMDLDHTFTRNGQIDNVFGDLMAVKTTDQLKEYASYTDLPFIIKGILSVSDAVKCADMGADAIVVSHHGGRILSAVPPLMILPEIKAAVGDRMKLFVDCGVQSGVDAYKAMALGADAVSVGNHLLPLINQGGADAVTARILAMNDELRGMMAYTGVKDVASFDPTVIHRRDF